MGNLAVLAILMGIVLFASLRLAGNERSNVDDSYVREGYDLLHGGQFTPAIYLFTHAIELDPASAKHTTGRASVYESTGYSGLARKDLEMVLRLDPVIGQG